MKDTSVNDTSGNDTSGNGASLVNDGHSNDGHSNDGHSSDDDLTIVGIGASAGGLDALERFFNNVPEQSGLAFVVVQHLSPTFKSLMHELLARYTKIPIFRVEDSMVVEPNAIYLIPPGQNMILNNGHLLLNDQDASASPQLPIDIFFRSIAHDCGPRGVAVVLSGTGSDGSRGIMDVHQAGGLIVVQSPDSAGFDGMPRNALAKDVVDITAAPEDMPRLISERLAGVEHEASETGGGEELYISTVHDSDFSQGQSAELLALFSVMRKGYQIDFSLYKPATILRRIERRMTVTDSESLRHYVDQLTVSTEEQELLFRDFLVEVTEFFRDPSAYQHLEAAVVTLLDDAEEGGLVRGWVAGCATGEEAYSMAILFDRCLRRINRGNEETPKSVDIQIFATDVHQGSLAIGAKGSYSPEAVTHLLPDEIRRYFDLIDDIYHVKPSLRKMVVFAPHNLLQDPPFTRLDLITCRNVLIYLNSASQEKVLSRFHFGLKSGGILFLGGSEHLAPTMAQDFRTVSSPWRIFRKESDSTRFYTPAPSINTSFRPVMAERRLDRNRISVRNELYECVLDAVMPPSLLLDANYTVLHIFGSAGEYLNLMGEASLNVLDIVDSSLAIALRSGLHRAKADMETVSYSDLKIKGSEGEVGRIQLRIQPIVPKNATVPSYLVTLVPHPDSARMASAEEVVEAKTLVDSAAEPHRAPGNPAAMDEVHRRPTTEPDASNDGLNEETPGSQIDGQNLVVSRGELVDDSNLLLAPDKAGVVVEFVQGEEAATHITQLERELQHTREYLHTAVEELETTNEELQSANEELIASNEELQSTNEELQSVNEELHTVNLEHQQKILELQQLNTDVRNLQQSTRMAVLFLDKELCIRSYSDMAATLFNLLPQDIARPLQQIYLQIGVLPEQLDSLARQVLETTEVCEEEVVVNRAPHIMRLLPYITSEATVDGVVLVFYDISQLKAAQSEQAESEARFRTLVDSASDAIIVCSEEGQILEVNLEASRSLKYSKDELLQKSMADIEQLWSINGFLENLIYELEISQRHTFNGVHVGSDGQRIPVENQVAKMVYQGQTAFLLLCRDITLRSEAERDIHRLNKELSGRADLLRFTNDQLSASNAELDRFVQIAAHDLKEPLRGLEHYAHMLEQQLPIEVDDETKGYITSIRRLSHRMNMLINDLRIYGRLDNRELQLTPVDLNEVLVIVRDNLHALFEENDVTLSIDEELPEVEYYEHHATLIFQNLISNAIRYNDKADKQVVIGTMPIEGNYELLPPELNVAELPSTAFICSIRDNGIGIPERHQEKIFDMFRRLHVQDAYGGGTGAGLALVKKVVELSGGWIWLTSEPGEGTTFYLIL